MPKAMCPLDLTRRQARILLRCTRILDNDDIRTWTSSDRAAFAVARNKLKTAITLSEELFPSDGGGGETRVKHDLDDDAAMPPELLPIPVGAAEGLARTYGYDQIVIIGRRVGADDEPHGEHVTTYGVTQPNKEAAAKIGHFLKYQIMGWNRSEETIYEDLDTGSPSLPDDLGDDDDPGTLEQHLINKEGNGT